VPASPLARVALLGLSLGLLFPLLSACSPGDGLAPAFGHTSPVYGGRFVFAGEEDIRTMDPAIGYDEVSWTVMHLVFEQLLAYSDPDEDGQVHLIGGLAEAWEVSEDGLSWTFHLRHGVRFHAGLSKGREMTADDVIYSWTRLFDAHLASPGADFYAVIQGADAVLAGESSQVSGLVALDPWTVQVHLVRHDATFANAVAMTFGSVVPAEDVKDRGEQWSFSPVGTGPFRVESWDIGEKTAFTANRDYWQPGLPYLDEIVYLPNYTRSIQFLKLEAGELDQVNRLTSPDYLWVRSDPAWSQRIEEIASVDTYGEMLNTQMPPFDDVWFRRGVAASINRDKLNKLRNGRAHPTVSWVPPGLAAHVEWDEMSPAQRRPYRYQRYDPGLARQCLDQSRYFQDGHYTGPGITYWALNDEASAITSQSVQQDLASVGVPLDIKTTTFPTYLSATGQPQTVQMAYTAWVMDYPDPKNFLDPIFDCDSRAEQNSQNSTFYCDPETDRLLDAADVAVDPDQRTALYEAAQARIMEAAPVVVEYHSTSLSVTLPVVRGFKVHPIWTRDMSQAWLDVAEGRPSP